MIIIQNLGVTSSSRIMRLVCWQVSILNSLIIKYLALPFHSRIMLTFNILNICQKSVIMVQTVRENMTFSAVEFLKQMFLKSLLLYRHIQGLIYWTLLTQNNSLVPAGARNLRDFVKTLLTEDSNYRNIESTNRHVFPANKSYLMYGNS